MLAALAGSFFFLGCVATVTEEAAGDISGSSTGRVSATDESDESDEQPTLTPFGDAEDAGSEEPNCDPDCTGRSCGDDGCGGSCGTCAATTTCNAGTCEPNREAGDCPPTGASGNQVGQIAPDITLYQCDGTPVRTHGACGTPVYVYSHSESCGSCIVWAQSGANSFAAQLEAAGAEFYFVITIGRGSTPDGALCERVRSEYGLDMPVYYITNMWDFAEAYGSVGAGPGALLDADHRIATTGSAKSSSARARILDVAASF
jgi:hypothetical protein